MTRYKYLLLGIFAFVLPLLSVAQGIAFNPFYATPTNLNPAFAGMFDGSVRAGALYRNQWSSITVPYLTLSGSVDGAVVVLKDRSYIAAGVQVMKDQAGDGNLNNFSAVASASYHRSLAAGKWLQEHPVDVGVGVQLGFSQLVVGAEHLYYGFDIESIRPFWFSTRSQFAMENAVINYPLTGGISIAQSPGKNFSYTLGFAVHNIGASNDVIGRGNRETLGIDRYFSFTAGGNWQAFDRLRITPALTYMRHEDFERFTGGCEFGFRTSRKNAPTHKQTSVFVAGWYRTGKMLTAIAGIECRGVKLGVGYDYFANTLGSSNGNGGYEMSLRYVANDKGHKRPKRFVPCSIF